MAENNIFESRKKNVVRTWTSVYGLIFKSQSEVGQPGHEGITINMNFNFEKYFF